ncbi:MAG: hypothetical protein GC204_06335 [Chloroflexi bacterium]|nr:hypothetical protein [Chloroflexota bacterium]
MVNLARVERRPNMEGLSDEDRRTLDKRFDANAWEINIEGGRAEWGVIDEVEVAKAARERGPAGWFVKKVIFAGDRYHVGVYFGNEELVLTNVTLEAAKFVVETIAYYANNVIRYKGPEDLVPVAES